MVSHRKVNANQTQTDIKPTQSGMQLTSQLCQLFLTLSICTSSDAYFANVKLNISEEVYKKVVSFSDELTHIDNLFQDFLKTSVLSSYSAQAMDGKGEYIIRKLYSAFSNNSRQLPDAAIASFCECIGIPFERATFNNHVEDNKAILHRCIIDYIGGMTDKYAYDEYNRLYGTKF